jgi:nucleoside-diphosphate-sugar epimerase
VGEAFNVTADAVSARYYVEALAEIVGEEADVVLVPEAMVDGLAPPAPYNHRFQRFMHSMLGTDKARRVLGVEPRYDFVAGHRQTYGWFMAEGLDRLEEPLRDPVWNVSWDFDREAEIAAAIRGGGS